MSNKAVAVLW